MPQGISGTGVKSLKAKWTQVLYVKRMLESRIAYLSFERRDEMAFLAQHSSLPDPSSDTCQAYKVQEKG